MRQEGAIGPSPKIIVGVGLAVTALFVSAFSLLMEVGTYEGWGTLLLVPVLFAITIPVLARTARAEQDRGLFWLLVIALALKLIGALVRHAVAFELYEGVADATEYHEHGVRISDNFRNGIFDTGLPSLGDTDFIRFLTGLVYTVIGPNRLGAFLLFSWLGFWGLFLFARAFSMAVPEGRSRTYLRILILMPSMVFWPSSIGKESWMILCLGMVSYGAARVFKLGLARGAVPLLLGLTFAAIVRPHVAGMMGVALAGGAVFRKPSAELRELRPVVKGVTIAALGLLALLLVNSTQEFLDESGIYTDQGLSSAFSSTRVRTQIGGSSYNAPVLTSPTGIPTALVTVLFRPFPTEAGNGQMMLASAEAMFLLLFCLVRFRWVLNAIKSLRRQPYVAFAGAYVIVFVAAFSSIANFGLLARERVQLFPLFVVLLSIPPKGAHDADRLPAA